MRIRAVDMRTAANCSCILATRSTEEGKGGGGGEVPPNFLLGGGGGTCGLFLQTMNSDQNI